MLPSVKAMLSGRARRGQMQIGEMVVVMLVVIVIITGLVIWYVSSASKGATRAVDETRRIELATTAKTILNLPELHYTLAQREDSTIVDWERAVAFHDIAKTPAGLKLYSAQFAGYSAKLTCVTPCATAGADQDRVFSELELFDNTDHALAARNSVPFVTPVLLYDPSTRASSFGILTVTQVAP